MSFEFDWNGEKIKAQSKEAAGQAINEVGEAVLTEANKTVPHDEGTLERSGTVHTNFEELITGISYDTPYAVRWHEAPPGTINFKDPKARTKWLELTVKEMSDKIENHLANKFQSEMK